MSKAIDTAFTKLMSVKTAASKFSASAADGNRIIPPKTKDKGEGHSHRTREGQPQERERELPITWAHVWLRWRVKTAALARDRIEFIQFDVPTNIWFAR